MLDPFVIIDAVRKTMNDPIWRSRMEIEKRRPGWRREHVLAMTGILLILVIMLVALLMGWDLYL